MDMVRTETLQALVPLSHTSQGRALLLWEITSPGGGDALARSVFGRVLAITLSMPIVWGGGVGSAASSSAVAGPYRRGHGGAAATMVAVVPPPAPTGAAANLSTRAQVLMGYEICAIVAAVDSFPQEEAGDKKGLVERGDGMGGVAVDRKTCSAKTLEETNTTSTTTTITSTTTTAVPASSSKSVARDGFTNPFLALMVKHKALERLCQRLEDGDDAQRNRPRREYFTVEWMYTLRCLAVMSVQPEVQRLVFQRSKTMQILLEHASGLYWYRYRETATSTATGHTGASLASAHRVDAATAAQQASTLALLILHHLCFLPRLKTSICQDTRFLFTLKAAVLGYHGAAPLLLDPAAMAAMTSGGGGSLHTSMTVKHSSSLSGNHNAHNVLPFTPALLDILAQPHQSIMQQGGAVTASRALSTLFSPTSTSILGTVSQRPSMMEAGYDRRSTPLLDWAQRWRVEVSETETTLASGIVLRSSSSGSRADQRRCEWAPSVLCLSDTRERVRRQDLALSALWSLLYDHQKGKFYIRRLLFPDRSAVVAWDSVCNDARRMAASTASTEYTNKKCNKKNKKAGVGDQIESTQPQDQRCPCMPCTAPPSAAAYTDCSCKDEQERMNAHILQCVESVQFLLRDAE